MFISTIHQLPHLPSFEAAHKYFEATALPARSKKWMSHQRPLKDTRSTHYRIERGQSFNGTYYDLVLYSTPMARLYEPTANGDFTTYYMHHSSTSSKQYTSYVVGISPERLTLATPDGRKIVVPYDGSETIADGRERFTTKIVRNDAGQLLIEESWHPQMYRFVETQDDRAKRLAMEKELENLLLLAGMRLTEYEANFKFIKWADGFATVDTNSDVKYWYDITGGLGQEFISEFFMLGQDVYNFLVSRRHSTSGGSNARFDYHKGVWLDPDKLVGERVTERDFIKALKGHVLKKLDLKHANGAEMLPKFMEAGKFPKSNAHGWLRGRTLVLSKT